MSRLVDLVEGEVGAAGHVEQDALGAGDGGLEQRAGHRVARRVGGTRVAVAEADAHQRRALARHDRLDVGEVEVDEPGEDDQVADALHALAEHVVGQLERLGDRRLLVDHLHQPLVGDGDQGVDPALQVGDAVVGAALPLETLELEGLGDHADGQRPLLAGDLGHRRGRAGAGAAAHAGGDEHHVAVLEQLGQLGTRLLGRLGATSRVAGGAQPAGELGADAHLLVGVAELQRLVIGVHGDELDPLEAALDHPVDSVAAAATDAHNLDAGIPLERPVEIVHGRLLTLPARWTQRKLPRTRRFITVPTIDGG